MIDQNQLENVEYFGSMITDDARCTCENNLRISMAKAAFKKKKKKKKNFVTSQLELNLRKKLV